MFCTYGIGLVSSRIRARLSKLMTTFFRSANCAMAELERAIRITSHPGFIGVRRVISRNKRLTLFLTTAFPTFLPTEKTHRDRRRPLGIALNTTRSLCQELPLA